MTIEPTVWSSARSSKGRPTGSQRPHRPKARRTRPTTSSGRTKTSFVLSRRRERAEDTKPKSSNRPKNCWFMVGAGRREEGSRAESDKVQTSRYPTVAAPERRPAGTRSRVNAGNGSGRKEETRGWDDDTSSVVDGCADPPADGMAPRKSDVIAWRHRIRCRRARLEPSSRPILLWPWVTSPIKRGFTVANHQPNKTKFYCGKL